MRNLARYDEDLYAWAMEQAELLRAGRFAEADIANVAEEIESLGRSERRELVSRLAVLLVHLLKWQVQPGLRGNSWHRTIIEQRRKIGEHLDDNPSLRAALDEVIARAYLDALGAVRAETGLADTAFPSPCPWSREPIFRADFLP